MPSLVEIGPVVQEKIFKFCLCILLFHNYLPLEKDLVLCMYKLKFPLAKDVLHQV